MDRRRFLQPGLWMLVVAPIVTAIRGSLAVLQMEEPSWYWVGFALGGSLSGLGMILIGIATWSTPWFRWLLSGAALAGIGHYVLPATPLHIIGPSLVHLGTGLVLTPRIRWALAPAAVAALGAVLRHQHVLGQALLAVGAIGLLAAVVQAARSPT